MKARDTKKEQPAPPKVYCVECRHEKRHESAISRSAITGEFFMCRCGVGAKPTDTPNGLNFINKGRTCPKFNKKH